MGGHSCSETSEDCMPYKWSVWGTLLVEQEKKWGYAETGEVIGGRPGETETTPVVWSPSKDASPLITTTGVEMLTAGQEEEAWRNPTLLDRYYQQGPVKIDDWEELVKDRNQRRSTVHQLCLPASSSAPTWCWCRDLAQHPIMDKLWRRGGGGGGGGVCVLGTVCLLALVLYRMTWWLLPTPAN